MAQTAKKLEEAADPTNLPFRHNVQASGHGEIWTHSHEQLKFNQFGWRATNQENLFRNDVRVGNWNEEKFDIGERSKAKPLPSQYDHYYSTNYKDSQKHLAQQGIPEELKDRLYRDPKAFPGHQPEFDSEQEKSRYGAWITSTGAAYKDPRTMDRPVPQQ